MGRFRSLVLGWVVVRDKVGAVWETPQAGKWLIFIGTVATTGLLWWVPSPGIGVAVMGIAAAFMAARKEPSGWEKAGWTLMMFALLLVEIRAIRKDRQVHDAQLQGILAQEVAARTEATTHFQSIGDGIKGVVQQSQEQFKETTTQASAQFDATMNRAQENLNHMTGGNTYPLVAPIMVPIENTRNTFRLMFQAVGESPLFDVDVTLTSPPPKGTSINVTDYVSGKGLPYQTHLYSTSSLSPNRFEWLPAVTASENEQTDFLIVTIARNGVFHERLHVLPLKQGFINQGSDLVLPWKWSCEITRDKVGRNKIAHEVPVKKIPWQTNTLTNGKATPQQ